MLVKTPSLIHCLSSLSLSKRSWFRIEHARLLEYRLANINIVMAVIVSLAVVVPEMAAEEPVNSVNKLGVLYESCLMLGILHSSNAPTPQPKPHPTPSSSPYSPLYFDSLFSQLPPPKSIFNAIVGLSPSSPASVLSPPPLCPLPIIPCINPLWDSFMPPTTPLNAA